MIIIKCVDIICHAGAGRNLRMVGPGRGQPLGPVAGIEEMRLIGQPVGKGTAHHHDPLMRAIGLVTGKHVDIGPQRTNISKAVWCHADAVNTGDSADGVRHLHNFGDRVFLSDDIRAMRKTDKLYRLVQ